MAPKEDVYAKIKKFSTQCVEANLNQKANDLGKPMKELFRQNPEALNSYPEMGELVSNLANCWVETSNARVSFPRFSLRPNYFLFHVFGRIQNPTIFSSIPF